MIKQIVISSILYSMVTVVNASVGLDYLNALRVKAGMPAFTEQINLRASAQNHSDYMQTNKIFWTL